MENMEKEIIEEFKTKIMEKINKLDIILYSMKDMYDETTFTNYLSEKMVWKWCLDILSETERQVYNKKEE